MSKELEALDNIKFIDCYEDDGGHYVGFAKDVYPKDFEIIETALKRLEQQNALIRVLKEVFEFGVINEKVIEKNDGSLSLLRQIGYNLRREISNKEKMLYRDFILKECFPKELKALEIIKAKQVDVGALCELDLELYNKYVNEINGTPTLTKKEYNLLREIVK